MMRDLYRLSIFTKILLVTSVLISLEVKAQDVNFSQYNYTPFQINPGIIGTSNEAALIFTNRNNPGGIGASSNTSMLSALYPLINKKNQRCSGLGLNVYADKAGEPRIYRNTGASFTYAYNVQLSKTNSLSFGIQPGVFQKKISTDGITTASQWSIVNGYMSDVEIGEKIKNTSINYFSLSSGLVWQKSDASGRNKFYLGVAALNLNRARQSFTGSEGKSSIKYVVHGGIRVFQNDNFIIVPEALGCFVNNSNYFTGGARISFLFKPSPLSVFKNGDITLISRYASNHSFIMGLQLNQPNYSLGVSYDYGFIKNYSKANNSGIFEITFAFKKATFKKKKEFKTIDNYSVGQVKEFYETEKKSPVQENPALKPSDRVEEADEDTSSANMPVRFALKREFKFKFNEAQITDPEDKKFLEDLLKLLNSNKKLKMEIIGHADNVGTNATNQKVSEQRAKTVYDYLIEHGVDQKRLKYEGKGAKEPLVPNNSEANRAINRRVEFVIYK